MDGASDLPSDAPFRERLSTLINEAFADGVDVEGSYPIRNDGDRPDWDVEITPLAKKEW